MKKLNSFNVGAVTNLEVGLVDNQSYEKGTWFVNRWISPPANQPHNTTQPQNCQPQNFEDKICYVDRISCQYNDNNNIKINSLIAEITAGSTYHCNLARPKKRRRTRRSSIRWSSGTWSSTGRGASSSSTPGRSIRSCRIVRRGRRRLTSTVPVPVSLSLTPNPIHNFVRDHTQGGQGGDAAD